MIRKHESLPDALTRMADGLDRQASTMKRHPSRPLFNTGHINKLLQDSAHLRQAARIVVGREDQKEGN